MSFDDKGFLGENINEVVNNNYEKHKDIFKLCEDINFYAQQVKFDFKVYNNDTQGLLAITIFSKILNTFQAAVILYKHGLSSQAKMLTRIELESLFILKSIIDDEKSIDMLVNSERKHREILLKNIDKNSGGVFNPFLNEELKSELEELKVKNDEEDIKTVSAKYWAESSGLYYEYYYAHELLCKDVHVDIRNLEQYMDFDNDENAIEFNIQPNTNDIKEVLLHTTAISMVKAIMFMSEYCNLDNENVIEGLFNKFQN